MTFCDANYSCPQQSFKKYKERGKPICLLPEDQYCPDKTKESGKKK